jgi:mono/diheme cytochrome c family protein
LQNSENATRLKEKNSYREKMNLSAKGLARLVICAPMVITLAAVASFQGAMVVGGVSVGADGRKIYNARCSICHGVDGRGNTPQGRKVKAKDLRTPDVQNQSNDLLMETVMDGVGKMPGFEKKLSADQIQQVLAYIRELGQDN